MNPIPSARPTPVVPNMAYINRSNDVFGSLSITDMLHQVSKATYKTGYTSSKQAWLQIRPINIDDLTSAFAALQETAVQSAQKALLPLIFSENVQRIDDDYQGELTLHQIKHTEMGFYIFLINNIIRGATSLQVADNSRPGFRKIALDLLQTLLTRPSGRLIILSATRSNIPIIITESPFQSTCITIEDDNTIVISLNIHEMSYSVTLNEGNEPSLYFDPLHLVLGHELVHALNYLSLYSKLWEAKGKNLQEKENANHILFDLARDPAYEDLTELLAIEGIPGFPSENMLNYEFGFPPRYGHMGCINRPQPVLRIPKHGLAYDPQTIETILTNALLLGHEDDFRFIYPLLSSQQIYNSILFTLTHRCKPILNILEDDIKNLPQNCLLQILSTLLAMDSHTDSLHFLLTLMPAYIDFIDPNTGFMPIHVTTHKNCINNVKLLITLKRENLFAKDAFEQTACMHAFLSNQDTSAILKHFLKCNPEGVYLHLQYLLISPNHPNTAKFIQEICRSKKLDPFFRPTPIGMRDGTSSPKITLAELNRVPSPKPTLAEVGSDPSLSRVIKSHVPSSPGSPSRL